MARIEVIEPEAATGILAEVYNELTSSRGKIAEVHKIQSLNPQSIRDHMNLYMTVMFARSPLSRAEREMMAVIVSSANGCAYCIRHHGEALDHFWKDARRVDGTRGRRCVARRSQRTRTRAVHLRAHRDAGARVGARR